MTYRCMQKVPKAPQYNGAKDDFIIPQSGISIMLIVPSDQHIYTALSDPKIDIYIHVYRYVNLAKYTQCIMSRLNTF